MLVCLVLPAYNKASVLRQCIENIRSSTRFCNFELHIVVVNDGSQDNSSEVLNNLESDHLSIVNLPENRGKGFAIRTGVASAPPDSTFIGYFDSDLDIYPEVIDDLVETLRRTPECCGVIASKTHPESSVIYPRIRRFGSRVFSTFVRLVTDVPFLDTQTGAKVFRAGVVRNIAAKCVVDGYAFDVELLARLCRANCIILERPVSLAIEMKSTVSPRSVVRAFSDIILVWKALRTT